MSGQDSLAILRELIAFPTVTGTSNLDLIGYVQRSLEVEGICCTRVPSLDGTKANLFAMIGPSDQPGVILSGHTDVVPATDQTWSSDPFSLRVERGRAFGRGATDMKGFLACMLRAATVASRRKLLRPLILAFSYDEEIGCIGVRTMLAALADLPQRPQLAIIGEPTGMELVLGHKGKVMGRVLCRGVAGHSSDPDGGVNAVEMASDVVQAFMREKTALRTPDLCDAAFSVPFTTLHIGPISGGSALNIIPDMCGFEFEIRMLPGADPGSILQRLRAEAEAVGSQCQARYPAAVELTIFNDYPALAPSPDKAAVTWIRELAGASLGINAAYGTEAGLFADKLNIPAVVLGPGSVSQAHKPDEFISLDQLAACDGFLDRLIDAIAI